MAHTKRRQTNRQTTRTDNKQKQSE